MEIYNRAYGSIMKDDTNDDTMYNPNLRYDQKTQMVDGAFLKVHSSSSRKCIQALLWVLELATA